MQMLTEEQRKAMEKATGNFATEFHPFRDAWLRVLNTVVTVVTLGKGRVMPREKHRTPIVWDGVIK